jgi:hypothetical protein
MSESSPGEISSGEIFCVGGKFSPGTFSENPPEISEDIEQFPTTFSKKFL